MRAPSQPLGFANTPSTPRSLRSEARSPLAATPSTPLTFATFSQTIESEFIDGSAIAPTLFESAIALVSDTETFDGGDVTYPTHSDAGLIY